MADSIAFRGKRFDRRRQQRPAGDAAVVEPQIPASFSELFGDDDAFRWGHLYSKPTGTSCLWENEGLVAGWDAEHWPPPNLDNQPAVGTLNGNAFPWFRGYWGGQVDALKTADSFTGVEGLTQVTFYGAFITNSPDLQGEDFHLATQQGSFEFYARWGSDDRLHLAGSILNGEQWNDDTPASIVDDGDIHYWAFVRDGSDGRLYLDGVQIGATVGGLGAFFLGNTNGVYFGRALFENLLGGLYLAGIATTSLTPTQVGYLFDIMADYVGAEPADPTITSVTPGNGEFADTMTINGTDFTPDVMVMFRDLAVAPTWHLGDNPTYVGPTQITADIPANLGFSSLTGAPIDVMVMTSTAQRVVEEDAFVYGPAVSFTLSSLLIGLSDPTAPVEEDVVYGSGFVGSPTVEFVQGGVTIGTATNVTLRSPRAISYLPPALAAGTYDVKVTIVTTSETLAGAHESWSPMSASPTLFLAPGAYNGTQWTDSSGNGYHAAAGVLPREMSGYPFFNGTHYLTINKSFASNLFGAGLASCSAGSIVVGYVPAYAYADANNYTNAGLVAGTGATPTVAVSTEGFKVAAYDGAAYHVPYAGRTELGKHNVGMVRWDNAQIESKLNGGKFVAIAFSLGNGLDNGNGSNVGADTEIGRSYVGTQYFYGTMTFVFASASTLDNATMAKFPLWAWSKGLNQMQFAQSGATVGHEAADFTNTGTATWTAKAGVTLTQAGSPGPADSGSGPLFTAADWQLESSGYGFSNWSLPYSRHLYAKVTTTAIVTTAALATVYNNASPLKDVGNFTGLFLRKVTSPTTKYYAYMYDWDTSLHYAEVDITHLVDSSGAGSFSLQGMKKDGSIYVRVNNEPWCIGPDAGIGNTPSSANVSVGVSFRGIVHEVGAWPMALPGHVSTELAVRGGAARDTYALYEEGLRMWTRVNDAIIERESTDISGSIGKFTDIVLPGDPARALVKDPTATLAPRLYRDMASNGQVMMRTTLEGGRRVSTYDTPDTTATSFPAASDGLFETPNAQPFTVYYVIKNHQDLQGHTVYYALDRTGTSTDAASLYGDGVSYSVGVDGTASVNLGSGLRVVCVVHAVGATEVYDNDPVTDIVAGAGGGAGSPASLSLGTWGGYPTWGAFERIEHDGAHNVDQRTAIMNALAAKYMPTGDFTFESTEDCVVLLEPGSYVAASNMWVATHGLVFSPDSSYSSAPAAEHPGSGAGDPIFVKTGAGTDLRFNPAHAVSDFIPSNPVAVHAVSGFFVITPRTASVSGGPPWLEDHIMADHGGGYYGVNLRDNAGTLETSFWIWKSNDTATQSLYYPVTAGQRHVIHWRYYWDGASSGYIQFGVDGTWGAQVAMSFPFHAGSAGLSMKLGSNYSGTHDLDATMHAVGFYNAVKDDTFFNNLIAMYG